MFSLNPQTMTGQKSVTKILVEPNITTTTDDQKDDFQKNKAS